MNFNIRNMFQSFVALFENVYISDKKFQDLIKSKDLVEICFFCL